MSQPEILQSVDKDKLRNWLSNLVIPCIVKPNFFVQMGFNEAYVRQYLKKHEKATKLNGETIRGIRGISETDFLWGLSEAIGAYTSDANRTHSYWSRIRLCADACLAAIDRIDGKEHVNAHKNQLAVRYKSLEMSQ